MLVETLKQFVTICTKNLKVLTVKGKGVSTLKKRKLKVCNHLNNSYDKLITATSSEQQKHYEKLKENTEAERVQLLELVKTLETKLNSISQVLVGSIPPIEFQVQIIFPFRLDLRRRTMVTQTAESLTRSGTNVIRKREKFCSRTNFTRRKAN